MKKNVYIVHCVDTEGPLEESLDATFDRIFELTGEKIDVSEKNLQLIQDGLIDLNGNESFAKKAFSRDLLNYMNNWGKIDKMLNDIQSNNFRNQLKDSAGNGWIYNWFCLDHVDYQKNPRNRALGYHKIFDYYNKRLKQEQNLKDSIHFHYHPRNFRNEGHLVGTHWLNNGNYIYQILSRRIIDRMWFPRVNRPGFHVTRSDSNWFLEQFIPFDYANQSLYPGYKFNNPYEYRFGDWRNAPYSSTPYHPSHDDYQKPGNCRRWIARCMNVGTRHSLINQKDVDLSFETANKCKPSILSFTNHDFRDMRPDVEFVNKMIKKSSIKFPDVKFYFSEASQAFRLALNLKEERACFFNISFKKNKSGVYMVIESEIASFGPQPFFALKTKNGNYYHDNLLIEQNHHQWIYFFDEHTFKLEEIEFIGIASNNNYGTTSVVRINPETKNTETIEYV